MSTINISVLGLDDLQEVIDPKRIRRQLAEDIGRELLTFHSVLKSSIFNTYTANNDLDKRLVGKRVSLRDTGKNFIKGGLTYTIKQADLSKFPFSASWGNINAGATRRGLVHKVTVKRGEEKVVYGKQHRGGFMPRKGQRLQLGTTGTPMLFGKHGHLMFERTSRQRYPLRLLFGPSTDTMINNAFATDSAVKNAFNTLENNLLDTYF